MVPRDKWKNQCCSADTKTNAVVLIHIKLNPDHPRPGQRHEGAGTNTAGCEFSAAAELRCSSCWMEIQKTQTIRTFPSSHGAHFPDLFVHRFFEVWSWLMSQKRCYPFFIQLVQAEIPSLKIEPLGHLSCWSLEAIGQNRSGMPSEIAASNAGIKSSRDATFSNVKLWCKTPHDMEKNWHLTEVKGKTKQNSSVATVCIND